MRLEDFIRSPAWQVLPRCIQAGLANIWRSEHPEDIEAEMAALGGQGHHPRAEPTEGALAT